MAGNETTNGGEGGIRTHGRTRRQRFSRPPDSSTLAPLLYLLARTQQTIHGMFAGIPRSLRPRKND